MEKNNQHIENNKLIALYYNDRELSLQEIHEYKKHLQSCQECQATFDDIRVFDEAILSQPHKESYNTTLEDKLLEITQQQMKQSEKGLYVRFKSHFRKHRHRYVKVAAGLLFFTLFRFTIPTAPNYIAEECPICDKMSKDIMKETDDCPMCTILGFDWYN